MFCNQCGSELPVGAQACPQCARLVEGTTGLPRRSRLEQHLRPLGILWMIAGVLFLLPGVILLLLGSLVHIVIPGTEEMARLIGPLVMTIMGATLFVLATGGILVGWGLLHHEGWARLLAVVLGVLALFHPPFGTALGAYTLWVLLSGEAGTEYGRLARA